MLTGISICNNVSFKVVEQALLRHGITGVRWPVDERQLSALFETYVNGERRLSASSDPSLYLITYMFHEALTFYELLLNDNVRDHHVVLRMVYEHFCRVMDQVEQSKVCSSIGLQNLRDIRYAMLKDLQQISNVA